MEQLQWWLIRTSMWCVLTLRRIGAWIFKWVRLP